MIDQWIEEALRQAIESPGMLRTEKRGRGHAQNLLRRLAGRGAPVGKANYLSRESSTGTRVRYFVHGESDWSGTDEHQRDETYAAMLARHQTESAFYTAGTDQVGWWRMEEASGNIADSSGNGNAGVVTGCTYRQGGIESYSLSFDGIDDVITVADATELQDVFDGVGTLEAWIFPLSAGETATATQGGIIAEKGVTPGAVGWRWDLASGATGANLLLRQRTTGTTGVWTTSAPELAFSAWHHVVLVYNTTTMATPAMYVNGAAATVAVTTAPTGTRQSDVGYDLTIGNNTTTAFTFDGRIDELALWTRALTAEEIRAHYYGGRFQLGLKP